MSSTAPIEGFICACHFLIGIDDTHLKSKYLGTVLCATTIDGEGALFPLAFAIVDAKNNKNWM